MDVWQLEYRTDEFLKGIVVVAGREKIQGRFEVLRLIVVDTVNLQQTSHDLFGRHLHGPSGKCRTAQHESPAGSQERDAGFDRLRLPGEFQTEVRAASTGQVPDLGFDRLGRLPAVQHAGCSKPSRPFPPSRVRFQYDHVGCIGAGRHRARGQAQHAAPLHQHRLAGARPCVAERGGDRRGRAIGRAGYQVRQLRRQTEDGGPFRQVAILGKAAEQGPFRADRFVAELHQSLALGPQPPATIKALAATPHHRPCNAVADCQRPAAIIIHSGRTEANDLGNHFVAEDTGYRRGTPSVEGMQVTAADRGATDSHQAFAAQQSWQREALQCHRLARGLEDGCPAEGGASCHKGVSCTLSG